MIAYESLNPQNRIDDAICVSMRWDDDTPGLYVVPRSQLASYLSLSGAAAGPSVQVVLEIEALAKARTGTWIGIKIGGTNGVAAWGHAKLEGTHG
jgi:hypothetical protein